MKESILIKGDNIRVRRSALGLALVAATFLDASCRSLPYDHELGHAPPYVHESTVLEAPGDHVALPPRDAFSDLVASADGVSFGSAGLEVDPVGATAFGLQWLQSNGFTLDELRGVSIVAQLHASGADRETAFTGSVFAGFRRRDLPGGAAEQAHFVVGFAASGGTVRASAHVILSDGVTYEGRDLLSTSPVPDGASYVRLVVGLVVVGGAETLRYELTYYAGDGSPIETVTQSTTDAATIGLFQVQGGQEFVPCVWSFSAHAADPGADALYEIRTLRGH